MNTKNTKTAVIVLLIIANVFFIYNIISLKINTENIPPEMIDDAASILAKNGFIIDREKIPVKKPANWIYEGVYPDDIFADIVKNFSGVSDEELKESGDMRGPWGVSYTAGDYRFMFLQAEAEKVEKVENFKIIIIDRNYSAAEKEFKELEEETRINTEALLEKGVGEIQKGDIKKAGKTIKNFIKKYQDQDVRLGFDIIGFETDKYKNRECVLISQMVDGAPVDSHTAYIEIQDEKVKYFSGEWYFGGFIARSRVPLLDSVNILFKCLEIDGSIVKNERLEAMDIEYNVINHAEGFFLAPSWQLKFESGKKLSYDMITGGKRIKD